MKKNTHTEQHSTLFDDPCHVALDVYEGPMEILLHLAREQKVDLLHVKLAMLAEQYLTFITSAQRLNLEIATEYLVVAAWLTWLKSRLLLPKEEQDNDNIPAYQQEETLRRRLRHYDMIQRRALQLADRPQKGYDIFARGRYGVDKGGKNNTDDDGSPLFNIVLYDLLDACRRQLSPPPADKAFSVKPMGYTIQNALDDVCRHCIDKEVDYSLLSMLQEMITARGRSHKEIAVRDRLIVVLNACLELSKDGFLHLCQGADEVDIHVRRA